MFYFLVLKARRQKMKIRSKRFWIFSKESWNEKDKLNFGSESRAKVKIKEWCAKFLLGYIQSEKSDLFLRKIFKDG